MKRKEIHPRARAPPIENPRFYTVYPYIPYRFPRCPTPQSIESLSFFSVNDSSNLNQSLKKKDLAEGPRGRAASELVRSESSSIIIMNTAAVCNATKIRATVVVGKASASSAKRVVPTQRAAQRVVKVRLRCVVRCVLGWNGSEGLIE